MKIAYVDPGLHGFGGHNWSMLAEFEQALVRNRGHEVTVLASAQLNSAELPDSALRVEPLFDVHGYQTFDAATLNSGGLQAAIERAFQRAENVLKCADVVLMPTVYPLHLQALGRRAAFLAGLRIVLGLMLPASHWVRDIQAANHIYCAFEEGLDALESTCSLFAYSETGRFDLAGRRLQLATLLPPVSASTMALLRSLATAPRPTDDSRRPVIGFFGAPYTSKGFNLLVAAVDAQLAEGRVPWCRLRLAIPSHNWAQWAAVSLPNWVEVVDVGTTNETYLRAMAEVDAVWAFYDPIEYHAKMSGIIPEALALGKPVLVADGCHGILDFLERYAPGSFISGPFVSSTARALLNLETPALRQAALCARQHATLVRNLKDMDRYLAVCGLASQGSFNTAAKPQPCLALSGAG